MAALDASAVAALLVELGRRTALAGDNYFRAKAYQRAADRLAALVEPLDRVIAENRLRELPGIGVMFGLRLGNDPRVVVTTTPKPIKIIRELIADPTTVITRGSTYDNRASLAPAFLQQIVRKYEGTRLGRQELNAEILDDVPGALWSRALIEET